MSMEFEWSLYKLNKLSPEEISESFEDPFSLRLLPDSHRFAAQNRFFSLGCSSGGARSFSVYTSTGKVVRAMRFSPAMIVPVIVGMRVVMIAGRRGIGAALWVERCLDRNDFGAEMRRQIRNDVIAPDAQ